MYVCIYIFIYDVRTLVTASWPSLIHAVPRYTFITYFIIITNNDNNNKYITTNNNNSSNNNNNNNNR